MNKTNIVENKLARRSSKVQGGSPKDRGVIYSAECLKHDLIYIGQTGDTLSNRFNRHRSDINCYPDRCELPKHFHNNDCSFDQDIKISVLEKVNGSESLRRFKEDKWILRLDTLHPNGMNVHLSDLGIIYKSLFE